MTGPGADELEIVDLEGPERRELAVPAIRDGFVGVYRWHAKRQLREVPWVRAAQRAGTIVGVALLDRLLPEVGYVYYITVLSSARRQGVGLRLLDDALARYRADGVEVVYAAVQTDNTASLALFRARGFRAVERKERLWKDGGLGAWGLRSRMWLVPGEQLLGVRLREPAGPADGTSAAASRQA